VLFLAQPKANQFPIKNRTYEPASELLTRICAERDQLAANGKPNFRRATPSRLLSNPNLAARPDPCGYG
jgi:hypothetical protein